MMQILCQLNGEVTISMHVKIYAVSKYCKTYCNDHFKKQKITVETISNISYFVELMLQHI